MNNLVILEVRFLYGLSNLMKRSIILFILLIILSCKVKKSKVITYATIYYTNINTSYFEPLDRNSYLKLEEKKVKSINDVNLINELLNTVTYLPFEYQDEIDPRVCIEIKFTDSSLHRIFIDSRGTIMKGNCDTVYDKNEKLLEKIENILRTEEVKW